MAQQTLDKYAGATLDVGYKAVGMPCVSEGGALLPSDRRMLETLVGGATLDEVAVGLRLPVFRVRALLREALQAGLVREELGVYRPTPLGAEALRRSGAVAFRVASD